MKYCSKCGNELLDEAVICPKCGCPIDMGMMRSTNNIQTKRTARVKSAWTLCVIAFILNIIFCGLCTWGANAFANSIYEDLPPLPDSDYTVQVDIFTGKVTGIQDSDSTWENEVNEDLAVLKGMYPAIISWGLLSIVSFVFSILAKRTEEKSKKKLWAWLLIVSSIATPISSLVLWPLMLTLFVIVIGLVLFVPIILQIVAGVRFMQYATD